MKTIKTFIGNPLTINKKIYGKTYYDPVLKMIVVDDTARWNKVNIFLFHLWRDIRFYFYLLKRRFR